MMTDDKNKEFDRPLTAEEKRAENEMFQKILNDAIEEQKRKARTGYNPFLTHGANVKGGK